MLRVMSWFSLMSLLPMILRSVSLLYKLRDAEHEDDGSGNDDADGDDVHPAAGAVDPRAKLSPPCAVIMAFEVTVSVSC